VSLPTLWRIGEGPTLVESRPVLKQTKKSFLLDPADLGVAGSGFYGFGFSKWVPRDAFATDPFNAVFDYRERILCDLSHYQELVYSYETHASKIEGLLQNAIEIARERGD